MIYAIVLAAIVAFTAVIISLWNIWVLNMHRSGGPYAASTGAYTYRKFGIWHVGFRQSNATVADDMKPIRTSASNRENSDLSLAEWLVSTKDECKGDKGRWKKERQPISTT